MHSFIHLMLFFFFELYLNTYSKEIYSFICYYKKEKEVCSKYFYSKYFVVSRRLLVKKSINDNKSKLLFCFGQGKWIGKGVYYAKKIQLLLFSTPLVTGIKRFVGTSISKTTLKNVREEKFVSCWNPSTLVLL